MTERGALSFSIILILFVVKSSALVDLELEDHSGDSEDKTDNCGNREHGSIITKNEICNKHGCIDHTNERSGDYVVGLEYLLVEELCEGDCQCDSTDDTDDNGNYSGIKECFKH